MRKIQILGMALFAVFAFSAVAAASAFAASEWEVGGVKVTEALPAETEGLLSLIKLVSPENSAILVEVLCEGIFDGTVGPGSKDTINKVLNLAMEEIGQLGGLALECKVEAGGMSGLLDCKLGGTALLWAENLPWNTELELMEPSGAILDRLGFPAGAGVPAYEVECITTSGIVGSELCEGATSAEVKNDTGTPMGVFGEFSEAVGSEEASCSVTGAKTGLNVGSGTTWAVGGTVAAPEELNRLDTLVTP
jgi:hypothetical protein